MEGRSQSCTPRLWGGVKSGEGGWRRPWLSVSQRPVWGRLQGPWERGWCGGRREQHTGTRASVGGTNARWLPTVALGAPSRCLGFLRFACSEPGCVCVCP